VEILIYSHEDVAQYRAAMPPGQHLKIYDPEYMELEPPDYALLLESHEKRYPDLHQRNPGAPDERDTMPASPREEARQIAATVAKLPVVK
jgi:hypothetical protein